jgi:hypothetical protein
MTLRPIPGLAALAIQPGVDHGAVDPPRPGRGPVRRFHPAACPPAACHPRTFDSRLAVVTTPNVAQVTLTGGRLIVLNRHQLSARRGLIVTGGGILE